MSDSFSYNENDSANLGTLAVNIQMRVDTWLGGKLEEGRVHLKKSAEITTAASHWQSRFDDWKKRLENSDTRALAVKEYEESIEEFIGFWEDAQKHCQSLASMECPLKDLNLGSYSTKKAAAELERRLELSSSDLRSIISGIQSEIQPNILEMQQLASLFDLMATATKEMVRIYASGIRTIVANFRGA